MRTTTQDKSVCVFVHVCVYVCVCVCVCVCFSAAFSVGALVRLWKAGPHSRCGDALCRLGGKPLSFFPCGCTARCRGQAIKKNTEGTKITRRRIKNLQGGRGLEGGMGGDTGTSISLKLTRPTLISICILAPFKLSVFLTVCILPVSSLPFTAI